MNQPKHQDIYFVTRNSRKVYQTRDQRLQEVALSIDNWDDLSEETKEFMLKTCSVMGWGYKEKWWQFWKPKVLGMIKDETKYNKDEPTKTK